jgi:hypothetical protein
MDCLVTQLAQPVHVERPAVIAVVRFDSLVMAAAFTWQPLDESLRDGSIQQRPRARFMRVVN